MTARTAYTAHAIRWEHGWELHIDNEGVTQVRSLSNAVQQVRDYLTSYYDRDMNGADVIIVVDELGSLNDDLAEVREMVQYAADLQRQTAERSRKVAHELIGHGLSGNDVATVMGVSKQRVSQLTK